jgi:hypothetical protein
VKCRRIAYGFTICHLQGFEVYSKQLIAKPVPSAQSSLVAANNAVSSCTQPTEASSSATTPDCTTRSLPENTSDSDLVITIDEAVMKLQQLFKEKHGREPTPDEIKSWESTLQELDSEAPSTGEPSSPATVTTGSAPAGDSSGAVCIEDGEYVMVDHANRV